MEWTATEEYLNTVDNKLISNKKFRPKFKGKVEKLLKEDLSEHLAKIKRLLFETKQLKFKLIHDNIEFFIDKLGKENILNFYKNNKKQNFVKTVGLGLDPNGVFLRRKEFTNFSKDCLIRNTVGNEDLLLSKLDNNYPFWFIDSGYTNFLESNKRWHRLVRNHLHFNTEFLPSVDRLTVFKRFPAQWRTGGEKILVVEPGSFAASVFHIDLKTWKYNVEKELRKYTDKPIVFREKVDKKIRTDLYSEFCNEDYYAVISLNSNASTEAIWAGIPAITLGKHITNPVTRQHIADINNLNKPHLANWLCMLSYSQFTYDELMNGTAIQIVKKYHLGEKQ
jgi:hypothetical protein